MAGLRYSPAYYSYIKSREQQGNLVTVDSTDALFELLLKGRIDVFVNTKESVVWQATQKGLLDQISILDYEIKTSDYFFTVSKKSSRIQKKQRFIRDMDNCVRMIKQNGKYQKIAEKYGLKELSATELKTMKSRY